MQTGIKFSLALLVMMAVSGRVGSAQSTPSVGAVGARAELAVTYNYVHSNAPPGGCGCFNLNGGGANFAWFIKPERIAIIGDVSITHGSSISSGGFDLTLGTYMAGVRYSPRLRLGPLRPFGQVLAGVAHSSGSLVQGRTPAASNSSAAFAGLAGGGVDLPVSRRLSFRLIDADYLASTFDNGSNNHQNNLRLSMGIVLHF